MPLHIPMSAVWLAVLVVFGIIEGATAGLTSIWFAAGALSALVVALLDGPLWLQIVLFLVVSFVTLITVRPLARKHLTPKNVPTNADRVIGAEGIVTQAIDNIRGEGLVNVAGQSWTARSEEDQPIPAGTLIRVLRIEGVKVYVTPAELPQASTQR